MLSAMPRCGDPTASSVGRNLRHPRAAQGRVMPLHSADEL